MAAESPNANGVASAVAGADAKARWALLFGNFVIGTGVLAPAGLINDLAAAFAIDVPTVGNLVAYGAAVLCVEAPLFAFLTNRVDRRSLLTAALVIYAAGHFASAWAQSFSMLLLIRLLMIGGAAVFTPQAASAIGLIESQEKRAGGVAFIFLGWSLALAIGVPLVSLIGAHVGWSNALLLLGVAAALAAVSVYRTLPANVIAPLLSLAAWLKVIVNGKVLLILAVTSVFVAGVFTQYPYIAAELKGRLGAGPNLIAGFLFLYGLAGVVGSTVSASAIDRLGAARTATTAIVVVLVGLALWSASGTSIVLAGAGLAIWGWGGGPLISAQQARLIAADPQVASASVALNTSVLYAGQAIGTSVGGQLVTGAGQASVGYAGLAMIIAALMISVIAQRRWRG
jgi:MFS transporter, DHA1 family, inner membrane transport protein